MLNGYLYDATATETGPAYMLGKRYYSDLTETGAQQIAHDFSREILETLGLGMGLAGSRIYFVSDRTGQSEIWSMDYDGQNLKQHTNYNNITITPRFPPTDRGSPSPATPTDCPRSTCIRSRPGASSPSTIRTPRSTPRPTLRPTASRSSTRLRSPDVRRSTLQTLTVGICAGYRILDRLTLTRL
ncbi:MAG: hypothetical protein R2748_10640 [Bryobacterales bacterium]